MALELGRQGRALVECHYRWETVVERLEGFYDQLLAAPASSREQVNEVSKRARPVQEPRGRRSI
jgi:hypothetical protein